MKLIKIGIEMNEVKKTLVRESRLGAYVTPEIQVVILQSEGVLCSSVNSIRNEDFGDGGYYEL